MAKKVSTPNERIPGTHAMTPLEREQRIAVAAYYRALQRGFAEGDPVADWLQAEQEVDAQLFNLPRQRAEPASQEQLLDKLAATSQAYLRR